MDSPEQMMDKAIWLLSQTDAEFADCRVMVLRTEYQWECAESLAYQHLEGSVEDRKRGAKLADSTKDAHEEYLKAVRHFEFLRAQRKRAELLFEQGRSLNANRRQAGQI
jgi:hypothetical protein